MSFVLRNIMISTRQESHLASASMHTLLSSRSSRFSSGCVFDEWRWRFVIVSRWQSDFSLVARKCEGRFAHGEYSFSFFNESRDRGSSDRGIKRNAKKVKFNWNKEGRGGRSDGGWREWIERRNRGAWLPTKRVMIRMSRWCLLRQWAFSRFK